MSNTAVEVNGFTRDPYGGTRAGFSATTEFNRVFIGLETILNRPAPANT